MNFIPCLYLGRVTNCLSITLNYFVWSSFDSNFLYVFFFNCSFHQTYIEIMKSLKLFVFISFVFCLSNGLDFKTSDDKLVLSPLVSCEFFFLYSVLGGPC